MHLTTTPAHTGTRLDATLAAHLPHYPRPLLKDAFAAGLIHVNNRPAPKGLILQPHMTIDLSRLPPPASQFAHPNPDLPLPLIHQDPHLLAFNKPAGIPCHPNRRTERHTLANAIAHHYPTLLGLGDTPLMTGILHRIDTHTSGLTLAARTPHAYTHLRRQFQAHTIEKIYHALVIGTLTRPATLRHNLAHHPTCPGRIINADHWHAPPRPMPATTAYTPLSHHTLSGRPYTLLEVTIHTGVTHQIRAQLSFSGHPILGDTRYGAPPHPAFPRHFLHASALTLLHPQTSHPITLRAPLPPDLQQLLT